MTYYYHLSSLFFFKNEKSRHFTLLNHQWDRRAAIIKLIPTVSAAASPVIMTLGFDTKPYIRWGLDNNNLLNIVILSPSEVYMQIPKSYPNAFLVMSLNPEPAIDIPHEQPAEKRL
jgi:hypothetical protein